jgi:hypothetical protein
MPSGFCREGIFLSASVGVIPWCSPRLMPAGGCGCCRTWPGFVPSLRDSPHIPKSCPALTCGATGCSVPAGLASLQCPGLAISLTALSLPLTNDGCPSRPMAPGTFRIEFLGIPHLPKPGRYPEFPVRSSGKDRVCAVLHGKSHEVQGIHETPQEIGDMGHPSFVRGREKVGSEISRMRYPG